MFNFFKRISVLLLAGAAIWLVSCGKDSSNIDDVPMVPVNITINTSLPQYIGLQNIGNFVYLDGGYKGIYLYHNIDDSYLAFDRSCTYKPYDSCHVAAVDTPGVALQCGCCSSRWGMDGILRQGPAPRSLRQYQVYQSGNLLNITN